MRTRTWFSALLLVALFSAIGCTSEGSPSDEEQIRALLVSFEYETMKGDPAKAWAQKDQAYREKCSLDRWIRQVEIARASAQTTRTEDMLGVESINDLMVDGVSATAMVKYAIDKQPHLYQFVREEDKWKIVAPEC